MTTDINDIGGEHADANHFEGLRFCPVCSLRVSWHDWHDCGNFGLWDLVDERTTPCPCFAKLQPDKTPDEVRRIQQGGK